MLTAVVEHGWRGPTLTVWGSPQRMAAVPQLLCEPGSRPFAELDDGRGTLWVDVVLVGEDEPLDDIGQRVLRATVVAEDRIQVAISDGRRAQFADELGALLASLQSNRPGGDHVHLEWYYPIDDPAIIDDRSPYFTWVFGTRE